MLSSPQCGAGAGGSFAIKLSKGDVCHSSDFIVIDSVMENLLCLQQRDQSGLMSHSLGQACLIVPLLTHELDCFKGITLY